MDREDYDAANALNADIARMHDGGGLAKRQAGNQGAPRVR